jgi:hypothetical protein
MRSYFVSLLVFQMSLCSFASCSEKTQPPSFHILVMSDSSNSKLHKVDTINIKKTFEGLVGSLKRPLHLKIVKSRNFSVRKLEKWTKKIRSSIDIAFIYYSGPQVNNPGYCGTWPSISMSSQAIPVEAITQIVKAKNPKLALVIADCYDKVFQSSFGLRREFGHPIKKTKNKSHIRNFQKTWFQSKGILTICSHERGKIGYGMTISTQYKGGVFTEALLRELKCGRLSKYPQDLQMYMPKDGVLLPTPQHIVFQSSIEDYDFQRK